MVWRVSRKVRIVAEFEVSSELEREEGLEASHELERDRDLDTRLSQSRRGAEPKSCLLT
jgi:hypothetical protein